MEDRGGIGRVLRNINVDGGGGGELITAGHTSYSQCSGRRGEEGGGCHQLLSNCSQSKVR